LRKLSKHSNSSSNFSISRNSLSTQKINIKNNDNNIINKARLFSFPSRDIINVQENKKSFKSNILKMNKIIEKDKNDIQNLNENDEPITESVLTTYNYREYLVKTLDGRVVYHKNGPLINNFFKQFENSESTKNSDPKIKSILKKPLKNQEFVKSNSNDKIENNLLVKMKQDDINNDIYVDISNSKNEKNIKKQYFNFEKMVKIHEHKEIDDNNDNNEVNENNNNSELGVNDTIDTNKNENIESLNVENENGINNKNNSAIMENDINSYNREDLLNFLNIDNIDNIDMNKNSELTNEEFQLREERDKHDQEFLTKMEYYQDILNIATISALTLVDLIEHNVDIKPIIQNIIYNIQQNISLFSEEDIKHFEDMVCFFFFFFFFFFFNNNYNLF